MGEEDYKISSKERRMKLKVGGIIEAKGGDKFKILKIDAAKNKIRLKCLEYGIKMEMRLDEVEEYNRKGGRK